MMNFTPSENCLYKIVSSMDSNMVIDISQNPKQVNKAIIYKWHGGPNQKFAIRSVGSGKYAIFSAKNNLVLMPEKGSSSNGARIVVQKGNKQPFQFWEFQPTYHKKISNRVGYHIRSFSGKVLDVCEGKCQNQQSIINWDHHGDMNQIWFIEPV